ncbi:Mitochondrial transcription termination factor family protein [Striga hermonthica]|uniref:Mitochondrial transcription termination factor family protein n=1 Tax=Striga hermonthica TaxID=68872 RepID=A0A9N7NAT2_STRHE|nr:Mitochondrial transcription termination factor family protein [Striga hermonthica]
MPLNLQALIRSVLSRPRPNQSLANFSTLQNAEPTKYPPEKGLVVSFLINSCGLSPKDAVAASKKVHFDSPGKPNDFLGVLRKQGFTEPQISRIVRAEPKLLTWSAEKFILPKIQFFRQSLVGVSEKDVLDTVSRFPCFLTSSLEHKLEPNLDYLKNLVGPKTTETLFRKGSRALFRFDLTNKVIPNMNHLQEIGVPPAFLKLSLFQCVGIFSLEPNEFKKLAQNVREMGFDPSKSMFVLALHALSGKACLALWNKCYQVYQKWGWSRDDILSAFMKHPNCMLCSEKKVTAVLEFVVRELGREARVVARCPSIIFYSMERRIVPRCTLVRDLASKGLVKKDWVLTSVLSLTEKDFMRKYVVRFAQEAQGLCGTYALREKNVAFFKLIS